ncbi:MAG: PDZ domain-containing protein [Proteobacteria bacterium]|nr:PDZ domain-containing protein [Pseudomonadota bacterium]
MIQSLHQPKIAVILSLVLFSLVLAPGPGHTEPSKQAPFLGVDIRADNEVSRVYPNSTADDMKLYLGDRILQIDEKKILTKNDLDAAISDKKIGDPIRIIVERGGTRLEREAPLQGLSITDTNQ